MKVPLGGLKGTLQDNHIFLGGGCNLQKEHTQKARHPNRFPSGGRSQEIREMGHRGPQFDWRPAWPKTHMPKQEQTTRSAKEDSQRRLAKLGFATAWHRNTITCSIINQWGNSHS